MAFDGYLGCRNLYTSAKKLAELNKINKNTQPGPANYFFKNVQVGDKVVSRFLEISLIYKSGQSCLLLS